MATAAIQSRLGLIGLSTGAAVGGTDTLAELRNCTLTVTRDMIDATSNDSSGWRNIIPGTASWTARAEALYVPSTTAAQFLLRRAHSSGSSMSFLFMPSTAASGTYAWTGTAHISSWEIAGTDPNGPFAMSVEIAGHDALTESTST